MSKNSTRKGIILPSGRITYDPKIIAREDKKELARKIYGADATYKAMGGNVAKYYGKGGKVAGCGPAQNKS